jgi:cell wall assembly regulator SMI1/predicted DNA-binding WGR domain protein
LPVARVFWRCEVWTMRRFEFKEGSSNKFWEVAIAGNTLTVRFGRVGTAGQEKEKKLANAALAQKEQDKLVAEKVAKGYKEVGAAKAAKKVGAVDVEEPRVAATSGRKDAKRAAASKKSGDIAMADLLARAEKWLAEKRPDYHKQLVRGASAEELDALEKKFQIKLPVEFRELYQWRNGQGPNCSASLQQNWMFSRLEDIADSKETLDGMIGSDFEDPKWWRRGWVPFLSNGGGDHLCVDLAAEDGGSPGQLIAFYHDWEKRAVKYPSLQAWLAGLVESMEKGTLKLS